MTVEGPYVFNINLLDMSFKLVWSKGVVLSDTVDRSTNLIDNDSVLSPSDQIASETNHVDDDNCSSVNTNTLGGSQSRVDENGVMVSIRSVVENNFNADSDVPEHLRVLFLTTVENNDMPSDVHDFKQFLLEHQNTFAKSSDDLGVCSLVEHDIDTGDAKPVRQPFRRPPLASERAEDDLIDDMLRAGVTEPSESPLASPLCLVKKPDGTYRFCVDYRRVNAVSKQDASPYLIFVMH